MTLHGNPNSHDRYLDGEQEVSINQVVHWANAVANIVNSFETCRFAPEQGARDLFSKERFPIFLIQFPNNDGGEDRCYYGFPEFKIPGVKIGLFGHFNERVNPEDNQTIAPNMKDEDALRQGLEGCCPKASKEVLSLVPCMFSNSQDHDFILGPLENTNNRVFAACGFSGHGFKFATAIGEIMVDFVMNSTLR